VRFHGAAPDTATHEAMHHEAHDACFIANSVKSDVRVVPAFA
jgi:organic hydroperoxide reductase OsmC/OhrA